MVLKIVPIQEKDGGSNVLIGRGILMFTLLAPNDMESSNFSFFLFFFFFFFIEQFFPRIVLGSLRSMNI